ncbi:Alpha-amylase, partial [Lachnellula cervina]
METFYLIPDDAPCPPNRTMFEGFEWYIPADHQHWTRLAGLMPRLAALGITSMWIPPASKGAWFTSNGYDVYDLYDLGEFQQRGARCTKWGTKEELARLVDVANGNGIGVLFDAVFNHRTGADRTERAVAVKVDPQDRLKEVGKPYKIEAWTKFDFPGRGNTYSPLKWNKEHFNGVDHDHRTKSQAIWRLQGKKWAYDVDEELGNYDFLMCGNIDHSNPDVRRDLFYWVEWLGSQFRLGGLRIDAVKHYSASFLRDLMRHIDQTVGKDWFMVGEYWRADAKVLSAYIEYMNHRLSLFDVPLVESFSNVSRGVEPDLRKVFEGSLAATKPANAVTFVVNHDTQTGQSLETPVTPFFIPLAYALILLRANFGLPCVFWGDLYGSHAPPHAQAP